MNQPNTLVVFGTGCGRTSAGVCGVAKLPVAAGQFPQISGVEMRVDPNAPEGDRIRDVKVQGRPLDPAATYTLALPDFVLRGGDGYSMFKGATVKIPPERAPIDVDVVRKALGTRAIAPKVEGRIKRLDVAQKPGANCP